MWQADVVAEVIISLGNGWRDLPSLNNLISRMYLMSFLAIYTRWLNSIFRLEIYFQLTCVH